jgi:hypothetical protein
MVMEQTGEMQIQVAVKAQKVAGGRQSEILLKLL